MKEHLRRRRFRGVPAALALSVVFGLLALIASVSVGPAITPAPLLVIVVAAVLITVYVFTYVPRLDHWPLGPCSGA